MKNIDFSQYKFSVTDRFVRYAQVDTQSDPKSNTHPTTEKQKDLGRLLVQELLAMGISDAHMDEFCYVYGTLPSNSSKTIPTICFCSHMDTAPDCSGTNVKPLIHRNYQGQDIVLPDNPSQVIRLANHPKLNDQIGNDLITASGLTLLGADNKAGVAEIMDAVQYLLQHPEIEHGNIRILFTPDEEVGKGVDKIDMKKLAADFGYTMDGESRGTIEDETFSADGVKVIIHGIIAHPGFAKGKLVNALKIASDFVNRLPKGYLTPESTEAREGFIHPVAIEGISEKCTVSFIIRDFVDAKLAEYETFMKKVLDETLQDYPGASAEFIVTEQYRNMKNVLKNHPQVAGYAVEAIERAGLKAELGSIRGGTDGSRLSFMGLPCPNIFAGEHAIHSLQEWVSVQDMQKAVEVIVHLSSIWAEKSH
jgi:tripeptide aminopeptidase